jgi:hypothetical protein
VRRAVNSFIFLASLLLCSFLNGQTILTADGLASFVTNAPNGGGGGAVWTVVFTAFGDGDGSTTTTVSGVNTTGATLLVAMVEGASFRTFSDSPVNSYTAGTDAGGTPREYYLYCISPTTSASATFSLTQGASFIVVGLKKTAGGTPAFDAQGAGFNGNFAGAAFQPGSITPATTTDIMLSSLIIDSDPATVAIDSSYTIIEHDAATSGRSLYFALKQKSDSIAENPTWTSSSSGAAGSANHMAFK